MVRGGGVGEGQGYGSPESVETTGDGSADRCVCIGSRRRRDRQNHTSPLGHALPRERAAGCRGEHRGAARRLPDQGRVLDGYGEGGTTRGERRGQDVHM